MPKIIEDIKETIINEARRQVLTNGYSHMTIRSVASGCGIAIGTIYNYYKSKDVLVASFMLADWMKEYEIMKVGCEGAKEPSEVFLVIYQGIEHYCEIYKSLFEDTTAAKSSAGVFTSRHRMLREQLSDLLKDICKERAKHNTPFLSDFLAESLITWVLEGKSFEEIDLILEQLF